MARVFVCIFMLAFLFLYAPKAGAWSDDVEGVLIGSPNVEEPMAGGQSIEGNLDESPDRESYDGPLISFGGKDEGDE